MIIIPAIDIIEGKSVRLSKGDYSTQKIYSSNVVDLAKSFQDHGLTHLHLVDLDGAKSAKVVNYKSLEKICNATSLRVDFSGGLSSTDQVQRAFDCGASQISVGSIAYKDPDLFEKWLNQYGSDKVILGADSKDSMIKTRGWLDQSDTEILSYLNQYILKSVQYAIVTDIDKDGMLQGPSVSLYKQILKQNKLKLIASGGISSLEDLQELKQIGCYGAIVGKAIYENKISLKELENLW